MSQRFKFENKAELDAAFARVLDQGWLDSCTVDVPALELHVGVTPSQRANADAWIARERRHRRRGSPARD